MRKIILSTLLSALLIWSFSPPCSLAAETKGPRNAEIGDADLGIPPQTPTKPKKPEVKRGAMSKEEVPPIKMIFVKGGCYMMGDDSSLADDDERPVHKVCLTDFYLSETKVTQSFFEAMTGANPSITKDPDAPVTNVSWIMAHMFIRKLNDLTRHYYRLPTEAEWEYAARSGGKAETWSGTSNEGALGDFAVYVDNSGEKIAKVKTKKPNGLGFYDMSGNVWEWTEDNFDFDYYKTSPAKDPYGPESSFWRVIRGGSYTEGSERARTTYRYALEPEKLMSNVGFRLAE